MSDVETDDGYKIHLTERQQNRFESIREECKEADPGLPAPTDEQLVKGLLDTWDAVGEGHYSEGEVPEHGYDEVVMWPADGSWHGFLKSVGGQDSAVRGGSKAEVLRGIALQLDGDSA